MLAGTAITLDLDGGVLLQGNDDVVGVLATLGATGFNGIADGKSGI